MTEKPSANDINAALPTVLRNTLSRVRSKMKTAYGPDAIRVPDAEVSIKVGWDFVRAVYQLSTAVHAARTSRDGYLRDLRARNGDLDRVRADIVDHDLLQNRSVVSLLVDVRRLIDGEDMTEKEMHDIRQRVEKLITRARKQDRRKKTRL